MGFQRMKILKKIKPKTQPSDARNASLSLVGTKLASKMLRACFATVFVWCMVFQDMKKRFGRTDIVFWLKTVVDSRVLL